jgi:hypothetical protein
VGQKKNSSKSDVLKHGEGWPGGCTVKYSTVLYLGDWGGGHRKMFVGDRLLKRKLLRNAGRQANYLHYLQELLCVNKYVNIKGDTLLEIDPGFIERGESTHVQCC